MSDIESYLSELRSHLTDLDPRRTKEIIAEARTHLEAHAAQLEAGGKSHDEACIEAVKAFGAPQRVALELIQGNARHQRPYTLRAFGAIAFSLGAAFAIAKLSGTPESRDSLSFRLVSSFTGLGFEYASLLLMVIALIPAALLAGMIGGRRFWWLAGAPGLFWIIFCWTLTLTSRQLVPYMNLREQLLWALALPGISALVLAEIGWMGERLSRRPRIAGMVGLISGLYVIWLAMRALGRSFNGLDAFGIALVAAQPALLIVLVAALRDRLLKRRQFLGAFVGICALTLLVIALWVLLIYSAGAGAVTFGNPYGWFLVAVAESVVGLVTIYVYWRLERHTSAGNGPILQ